MLSRLQELRKEEETLLRLKAALHDQLNRLKVEELALQSMISSRRGDEMLSSHTVPEQSHDMLVHVDNEASINQTTLELSTKSHVTEEEEEEEEESDS
ncbi:snRNA-activating protein complex subunit 5 [Macaca thibetana thibetana]|uniref:snRNA-activating protein complex subunit 5 n=1 Tax=Macaca thibetana thibetana TaxID=257877 RepID=UPI0021BCE225|nr:snRNA-activating protein complex subunit 5 [Macaca thibetana thibetana]XP_050652012.1 snRNA-activating protein complex subunit 5 [Macaca thibetana thibetana]XP_050652013.1 snRNA-activating protein complex subunit 5 [Macaca thibetana thibetana]XP_050652014.1 snRNA-activating protein complex subunit 5 [Macaca thibetana thibetana]XP_050652015.1 snRNA-activating protein complex subunit 5 [Macaca thibetana thibetana]XP_050652016.1 snRNA-activating protein complex subunit 5 [Macaca thibetana thib